MSNLLKDNNLIITYYKFTYLFYFYKRLKLISIFSKMANQSYSCVLAVVFHPNIDVNNGTNETSFSDLNIHTSNSEDDFKVIFEDFDNVGIKIITGILYFCLIFFNNAYHLYMIWYDKDNTDPMKRSIVDQIIPFMGYTTILHNMVCSTLWTWRILFGPLYLVVAEFEGSDAASVNQILSIFYTLMGKDDLQ